MKNILAGLITLALLPFCANAHEASHENETKTEHVHHDNEQHDIEMNRNIEPLNHNP
jgi:hypothetical protein